MVAFREINKEFNSHLHAFGSLGIIYEIILEIEPEFGVEKCIYENVSWVKALDLENFLSIN